ncbi:mucoidy inhibitor MuiA family protein [Flammeovirga aprica]|uniref:Mucoidy inhibitor MuiA family protein n=1 Tax=Flammeovirga aprica JL-4 TaxID=694437 RepID=A0A7X9P0N1_9BACT|nr:mucoidy inhibitor MuiA family protein [Flammeovirga aprica]NME67391.1 mucoidy inhibitor MuiA family protein [Flammeovirga aprica JL-4]
MKTTITLLLLLFFQSFVMGQSFQERKMKSSIKSARVFLKGAELSRKGFIKVSKGKYKLTMNKLSTSIDGNSVQVKGKGNFIILSSKFNINVTEKPSSTLSSDSLLKEIKKVDLQLKQITYRETVLSQKEDLIAKNIALGSEQKGVSSTELTQMLNLYEVQLTKINNEYLKLESKKEALKEEKINLEYHFKQSGGVEITKTGEIVVEIESKVAQTITLEASYYINDAGWLPKYDIRAVDISKPLKVEYKADVYQNTGVEWKNVALTLSNGEPNQSGVMPQMRKWELNYPRYTRSVSQKYDAYASSKITGTIYDDTGIPLPGVNIVFEGTTIGTVTDFDGNFSLTKPTNATHFNVSYIGYVSKRMAINKSNYYIQLEPDAEQLEEVVVIGYGSVKKGARKNRTMAAPAPKPQKEAIKMTSEMEENTTTVDFKIEKKYTIKSGTGTISVNMKEYQIPVEYQYFSIPKLDKSAFLIAKIPSWDQYNLLSGEANLFLEGGYVGTTLVEANTMADTLDISLGRDKSIVVNRNKVDELAKKKSLGSSKTDSRAFELKIRNKKSSPIKIEFYDQVPVSVNSEITVEVEKLSGGKLNDSDGFIVWKEEIAPGKSLSKSFKYSVKYPKKEKVILE